MWRTCWDFRSQFWASSGHSSRLPLKPRFRAIQRYKNYPLRAKIEVQRFSRPFCGSVGAKCASAHMMRSNTKIQINSANSDLILQAHFHCAPITITIITIFNLQSSINLLTMHPKQADTLLTMAHNFYFLAYVTLMESVGVSLNPFRPSSATPACTISPYSTKATPWPLASRTSTKPLY